MRESRGVRGTHEEILPSAHRTRALRLPSDLLDQAERVAVEELAAELDEFYCEVVRMTPGRDIEWAWRLALLGRIDGLRRLAETFRERSRSRPELQSP